jgi:tRNA dimethylallyltransferase
MSIPKYNCIFVIGPTAGGKTNLATQLAHYLNGEIISADSRQVYKRMNIGTGKDLNEYVVHNQSIPYHLIDICEPGEKYNIERFYNDAKKAFEKIWSNQHLPIVCGGSGLYIETLLKGNPFATIPKNPKLRNALSQYTLTALHQQFNTISPSLKNSLDNSSIKKCLRSIEIDEYIQRNGMPASRKFPISPLFLAPKWDREERRLRITFRLNQRLNSGMIEEVQQLLKEGISVKDLVFYGLEYAWIARYCVGEIDYATMKSKLEVAIHQFAKRQMTWFRRMEKQGFEIHWLNPYTAVNDALNLFNQNKIGELS